MKKLLTALLPFMTLCAFAQTSSVVATVPSFANGTATATFVNGGGGSPSTLTKTTTINNSGFFRFDLVQNTAPQYAPSTYTVQLCATTIQLTCYSATVTTSGLQQDITTSFAGAPTIAALQGYGLNGNGLAPVLLGSNLSLVGNVLNSSGGGGGGATLPSSGIVVATSPLTGRAAMGSDISGVTGTGAGAVTTFGLGAAALKALIGSNAGGLCPVSTTPITSGNVIVADANGCPTDSGKPPTAVGSSGNVPASDGTKFNPVAVSGDCTFTSTGVMTCLANTQTASTSGVTANTAVSLDAANLPKYTASSINTCGAGIAASTAAANATFRLLDAIKTVSVLVDGNVTVGDVLVGSPTTPGYWHDSGQTSASGLSQSVFVCGKALTASSSSGTLLTAEPFPRGARGGLIDTLAPGASMTDPGNNTQWNNWQAGTAGDAGLTAPASGKDHLQYSTSQGGISIARNGAAPSLVTTLLTLSQIAGNAVNRTFGSVDYGDASAIPSFSATFTVPTANAAVTLANGLSLATTGLTVGSLCTVKQTYISGTPAASALFMGHGFCLDSAENVYEVRSGSHATSAASWSVSESTGSTGNRTINGTITLPGTTKGSAGYFQSNVFALGPATSTIASGNTTTLTTMESHVTGTSPISVIQFPSGVTSATSGNFTMIADGAWSLSNTVLTPTGNTNSSTSITGVSSITGIVAGMYINGTGIPTNDLVTNATGTTITLQTAATATATGVTLTINGNVKTALTATAGSPYFCNYDGVYAYCK